MSKLERKDLMSLEEYSNIRDDFRRRVMQHKKTRLVAVGPHMMLHFEDKLVMQYQVQEMLRIEKIFDSAGIQEELDAYNPMIPDGTNFKATMMIEFPDPSLRPAELAKLVGIEDLTWVQVGDFAKVYAIADEDLERENAEKTSSVHFMRFELAADMIDAAIAGSSIVVGVDHENYRHAVMLDDVQRQSLVGDLQS